MPIYEYYCNVCKIKFDKFNHTIDKKKSECPKCKKVAERIISGTNFNKVELRSQRIFGHGL